MLFHFSWRFTVSSLALILASTATMGAPIAIHHSRGRTVYQTNEAVDLAIVRSATDALAAGAMELRLTSDNGSKARFTFPVPAVAAVTGSAKRTEHLHLDARLLRPGNYEIEIAVDGATAKAPLEIAGHMRKSDFKLINWGRAKTRTEQLVQGEHSLGFNTIYGHYTQDTNGDCIRAGVDFIPNCVMGGAHQMDIRLECDWSDPYVIRGGTQRVVRSALQQRTRGNVPGIHFYDEPGLTWVKHPETGEFGPHGVPWQVRSFEAAFGKPAPQYHRIDPSKPDDVQRWKEWAYWKLAFMDAAWKEAAFGVTYVKPDFFSVNQSQYGWTAYTDGYYFNVVRSLPITSGHGGYHDYGPGYFNPSMFLELARARDYAKPCWYLPTWYGNTTPDEFRMEQYLSFQTGIQGMISPPDIEPAINATTRQGVVESNQLMARLGPIFNTGPVTRTPVAMLYSLSDLIHAQALDRKVNYAHDAKQGRALVFTYLAGKLIHNPFQTIVDEDVIDGTLANNYKAIVISAVEFLAPEVIAALEDYIAGGGLVLLTGDCKVEVKGAVKLDVAGAMPDAAKIAELRGNKEKEKEYAALHTTGKHLDGAKPLAAAIKAQLDKAGIRPVLECDNPGISVSRHVFGEVEYFFAVNATYNAEEGKLNSIKATAATITLPPGKPGSAVYDAVRGGPVVEFGSLEGSTGKFRFGPGTMRVFARTAKRIGTVTAMASAVTHDPTRLNAPITVDVGAVVTDAAARLPLAGGVPVTIQVVDPLGAVRHELHRATKLGSVSVTVPLAANDPAGVWKVLVHEPMSDARSMVDFTYQPKTRAGSLAGATHRAIMFEGEKDNLYRFARVHHAVTIITGKSDFNSAAAERVSTTLKPWGVKCKVITAEAANKPRSLSEDEAATWISFEPGKAIPGDKNNPVHAGFDVEGPVILLGNLEDNPLIEFLHKHRFLPYAVAKDQFPGRGRGHIAWSRDGIGKGQESIALIAQDAEGMSEAVGTLYEAIAGLDPLTRWRMATRHAVTPATAAKVVPAFNLAWQVMAPDRVRNIRADGDTLYIDTDDGSVTQLDKEGRNAKQFMADAPILPHVDAAAVDAARKVARADRMLKLAVKHGDGLAIAYWGGTLELVDADGAAKARTQLPQDATALISANGKLIAGLADGRVWALQP